MTSDDVPEFYFFSCINRMSLPKSNDYKERQLDRKKHKVFVSAHVVLRTAAMFLASALHRGCYPPEILEMGH